MGLRARSEEAPIRTVLTALSVLLGTLHSMGPAHATYWTHREVLPQDVCTQHSPSLRHCLTAVHAVQLHCIAVIILHDLQSQSPPTAQGSNCCLLLSSLRGGLDFPHNHSVFHPVLEEVPYSLSKIKGFVHLLLFSINSSSIYSKPTLCRNGARLGI